MSPLYTIYRAPDGLLRTVNRHGDVALYLPAPAVKKLWAGMQQVEPDLADMFRQHPALKVFMQEAGARPSFTPAQLRAFNAAAEGGAE